MAADLITAVALGAAAALALKSVVELAETVETAVGYSRRAKAALDRAYIRTKIYSRRRSSRVFNFLWIVATGHPVTGPEDDPPPRPPGGGRKPRPGPIAFVGYSTRFSEPIRVSAA